MIINCTKNKKLFVLAVESEDHFKSNKIIVFDPESQFGFIDHIRR